MGLSSEVGTFTEKLTTGSQVVSLADSGITPKVIILTSSQVTADGRSATVAGVVALWADDSNAQCVMTIRDTDAQATMATARRFDNTKIFALADGNGNERTGVGVGAITSVSAGSFTINWTDVQGDARLINYLVLGGSDITNVDLNFIQAEVGGGTISHNIGFQPDCAISLGPGTTSIPDGSTSSVLRIGVTDFTTQIALGASSTHGTANAETNCRLSSGLFIDAVFADADTGGTTIVADADGYDLTWTAATASAAWYAVLAIKGIRAKAVLTQSPTATGTQNVTGAAATPAAALLFTGGNANTNIVNDFAVSVGFGSGASQQANVSWTSDDDAAASIADRSQEQDEVIQMPAMNGAAPTEEANWGGVTASGFDLNWTTADATQRYFGALMFIPAAAAGTVVPVFAHHYRTLARA